MSKYLLGIMMIPALLVSSDEITKVLYTGTITPQSSFQEETAAEAFTGFRESIRYEVGKRWFKTQLRRKARSLPREDAAKLRSLIRDDDRLETAYVTALSMMPQEMVESETPILDWLQNFLQWIIDNWDQIWPILQILFGMDADVGVIDSGPQPELSDATKAAYNFWNQVRIRCGNNLAQLESTTDWEGSFNLNSFGQRLDRAFDSAWLDSLEEFKGFNKTKFRNATPQVVRSGINDYVKGFKVTR